MYNDRNIFTNRPITDPYYVSREAPLFDGDLDLNNFNVLKANSIEGTLTTPTQSAINQVGTLSGLTMGGDIDMGDYDIINAGNLAGTLTTPSQPNIRSLGTMNADLNMGTKNITNAGSITANVVDADITRPAQPYITSLGNLSTLVMGGPLNMNYNNLTNVQSYNSRSAVFENGNISDTQIDVRSVNYDAKVVYSCGADNWQLGVRNAPSGEFILANSSNGTWDNPAFTISTGVNPITLMGGDLNMNTKNITNAGTVTATNLSGLITTNAQPNIRSLGIQNANLDMGNKDITNMFSMTTQVANITNLSGTIMTGALNLGGYPITNTGSVTAYTGNFSNLTMTGALNMGGYNINNAANLNTGYVIATNVNTANLTALNQVELNNEEANAVMKIKSDTADPMLVFQTESGTKSWRLGVKNTDDNMHISPADDWAAPMITLNRVKPGNIILKPFGDSTPTAASQGEVQIPRTDGFDAILALSTQHGTTADPKIRMSCAGAGGTDWQIGVDNVNGDTLKISKHWDSLSTNTALSIDTSYNTAFHGSITSPTNADLTISPNGTGSLLLNRLPHRYMVKTNADNPQTASGDIHVTYDATPISDTGDITYSAGGHVIATAGRYLFVWNVTSSVDTVRKGTFILLNTTNSGPTSNIRYGYTEFSYNRASTSCIIDIPANTTANVMVWIQTGSHTIPSTYFLNNMYLGIYRLC